MSQIGYTSAICFSNLWYGSKCRGVCFNMLVPATLTIEIPDDSKIENVNDTEFKANQFKVIEMNNKTYPNLTRCRIGNSYEKDIEIGVTITAQIHYTTDKTKNIPYATENIFDDQEYAYQREESDIGIGPI